LPGTARFTGPDGVAYAMRVPQPAPAPPRQPKRPSRVAVVAVVATGLVAATTAAWAVWTTRHEADRASPDISSTTPTASPSVATSTASSEPAPTRTSSQPSHTQAAPSSAAAVAPSSAAVPGWRVLGAADSEGRVRVQVVDADVDRQHAAACIIADDNGLHLRAVRRDAEGTYCSLRENLVVRGSATVALAVAAQAAIGQLDPPQPGAYAIRSAEWCVEHC
jgi:hypothetical protein